MRPNAIQVRQHYHRFASPAEEAGPSVLAATVRISALLVRAWRCDEHDEARYSARRHVVAGRAVRETAAGTDLDLNGIVGPLHPAHHVHQRHAVSDERQIPMIALPARLARE